MSQESNFYDLEQVKSALSGRIDDFVMSLFPEAKKEASAYKIGGIDGHKGGSMMISTRSSNPGWFQDFADPDVKGRPWKLVSLAKGIPLREAIQWLAQFCNVQPIQSFGAQARAKDPGKLASEMRPLSGKSIEYAKKRGISEATLRAYGVCSDTRDGLVFPYYDAFGQIGMTKHWGHNLTPEGKKSTWVSPDGIQCLFGKDVCDPEKVSQLVITEGEWDALALYELGIPAVSMPMGASNMNWITLDYHYLSHFDDIVLLFDSDEEGEKAGKIALPRLGNERCMIVKLPLKDANDMLRAGRGEEVRKLIDSTIREPIAEIIDPSMMREGTRSCMRGDHLTEGDGFFLPNFNLTFRKHEITLWFGFSGHGKSTAVANQIASLAAKGKQSCVASFEQQPEMTFAQILTQFTAYPNLPYTKEFDMAFDHLAGLVFMYKSMERADPKHLISTFTHAHKRYGIDTFVIDNVMTMNIDRGDNTAQADAIDGLRVFVAKYPVHLHIVAHPRKPPESTAKPPGMAEIRGASEWGDMPHNIITVWRDGAKAERIGEMENSNFSHQEIVEFFNSTPCGKIIVRKQRATGEWPLASFFFHKECKRFMPRPGDPMPMYSEKPWHFEEIVETMPL